MHNESKCMRFLLRFGFDPVAWSVRRLYCPVNKSALVLEVGSGGNPYSRSNVLIDAYENTRERHWVPLVADRPTVLGFVEDLPFRDKSFDFVIASHVLEHTAYPERFLAELQRVAKAGYIEVPDAFMERINPYRDHRLEVTVRDNRLMIHKKDNWVIDNDLVELYEDRVKCFLTQKLIPRYPFEFHVRYYWQDTIDFEVTNPSVDAAWDAPIETSHAAYRTSLRALLGQCFLSFIRRMFSQRRRNSKLSWASLLICPTCKSEDVTVVGGLVCCGACKQVYPIRNGIPVLYAQKNSSW